MNIGDDIMAAIEPEVDSELMDYANQISELANGQCTEFLNVRIAEIEDKYLKAWAGGNIRVTTSVIPPTLKSSGSLSIDIDADTSDLGPYKFLEDKISSLLPQIESGLADDMNRTAGYLAA